MCRTAEHLARLIKQLSVLRGGDLSILMAFQAPVLLSLEETFAQTAIPCAAHVLLVNELAQPLQPLPSLAALLFQFIL